MMFDFVLFCVAFQFMTLYGSFVAKASQKACAWIVREVRGRLRNGTCEAKKRTLKSGTRHGRDHSSYFSFTFTFACDDTLQPGQPQQQK